MKKIMYFGTRNASNGKYVSVQEKLIDFLTIHYNVVSASSKQSYAAKMLDMVFTFLRNACSSRLVIIDTYSTWNFYYVLIVTVLARFFNVPRIFYLHGGNLEKRLRNNPLLCVFIFKGAYALISPSGFMKAIFKRYGYDTILIPNFIDLAAHPFNFRKPNTINLFWLRNFKLHYNPLMAVKVLKHLLASGHSAKLIMIGPDGNDGSLQQVREYIAKHNLHEQISIPGAMDKQTWIEKSKVCNIIINTTHVDNTPLSVIECMALGMAVVSTNVGGIPYLLKDGVDALLVSDDDDKKMAEAISRLIADEGLYQKIVQNARARAETFDWEVINHKWINLIEGAR